MDDDVQGSAPVPRRRGRPPKKDRIGEAVAVEESEEGLSHTRLTLTVKHALSVLWSFSRENPSWGVNELSRQLGLNKSMVSRLLATLGEQRLVEQNPETEKFQLGVGVLELAGVLLSQLDLRRGAESAMRRLGAATRETVNLAILDRNRVVLIDQVLSPDPVRYVGWIGEPQPLYCASPGKVFLAFSDPELLVGVIAEGLERHTATTIVDPAALERDLLETRHRGYATNLGEFVESAHGVAAPIWRYPHTLAGALAVAGPAYRLTPERMSEFGALVRETAAEISRGLGALPEEAS
jgi:DNA-binding IclR family transcriptional regulator